MLIKIKYGIAFCIIVCYNNKKGGNIVSKKIMSTKGTNSRQKIAGILSGGVMIIVGIFAFAFAVYMSEYGQSSSSMALFILGVVALIWGIMEIALNFYWATAYIDIYDDHMEGKGIQQIEVRNFNINNSQIKNITTSGMRVQIHSDMGEFKIVTNKETAEKIFNYFQSINR